MKKVVKIYLHNSKEDNLELIREKNLIMDKNAEDNFLYTLYEVEFDVEVDLKTGTTEILKVNGQKLIDN